MSGELQADGNHSKITLDVYISQSIEKLKRAGIDNPALDARLLIGHALNLDRAALLSQSQRLVTDSEKTRIDELLRQRAEYRSVARIKGSREFWGLPFQLNEATLEPRPDSESLIETVLRNIKQPPQRILDLGTGTGCLLLALLHEFPLAQGVGVDLSPRAIEQATLNATALQMQKRSRFKISDWLKSVEGSFDLIVSNPPYIDSQDINFLAPEVRIYDPVLALDGGPSGLGPYQAFIPLLPTCLGKQGAVALEVGQGQSRFVAQMLQSSGFKDITIHKDLQQIERCIWAVFTPAGKHLAQ